MPAPIAIFPFDAFNEEVRKWGHATNEERKKALAGIGVRGTSQLIREARVRYAIGFGTINRIGFAFPRHLVHLEKGAGRGYGGRKGSTWFTRGQRRRTNPKSFGKMNSSERMARPTFNPVMDKRVPVLTAIISTFYGDAATRAIAANLSASIK